MADDGCPGYPDPGYPWGPNPASLATPNTSAEYRPQPLSFFRINRFLSELRRWEIWKAILCGQLISMLLCCTAITSQMLSSDYNVNAPTAQSFLNYVLLCMVYTTYLACRSGDRGLIPILRARGWKYLILSVIDVEANYLIVKAYQYTTLTSVQLLDCFTIPTVLALSWIFLKVRYKILHILGVGVCLLGVGCVVWADIEEGHGSEGGNQRLLGDMLCLIAATLYGVSNVAQEFVVKTYDRYEFLGMVGLFGSCVNGIQLAILERNEIATIQWDTWQVVCLLVGFALSMFVLYSLMPVVMALTSATAVNLSILSADFYALVVGIYLFGYQFHILYFVSFFLVITGVIMYSIKPTPIARQSGNYRFLLCDGTRKYSSISEF